MAEAMGRHRSLKSILMEQGNILQYRIIKYVSLFSKCVGEFHRLAYQVYSRRTKL
jgi:hypothetical protein